jgi:competence protein ComEA
VLAVVAVVAGVLWYRIGVAGGDAPRRSTRASAAPTTARPSGAGSTAGAADDATGGSPTTTTAGRGGPQVLVHVAGAVTHPGVVELAGGSRVIDAVEAAGGGLPDADLDRLNLAAKLVDGQRVLVQRVGDPAVATDGTGTAPDATGAPAADGTTVGALVNLNTATQAQLEELPGIGPALAGAILDERTRRGSFRSVNELRDVRGIGEKRFADLRDKVTV